MKMLPSSKKISLQTHLEVDDLDSYPAFEKNVTHKFVMEVVRSVVSESGYGEGSWF